jgi:hypothetical protein
LAQPDAIAIAQIGLPTRWRVLKSCNNSILSHALPILCAAIPWITSEFGNNNIMLVENVSRETFSRFQYLLKLVGHPSCSGAGLAQRLGLAQAVDLAITRMGGGAKGSSKAKL